MTTKKIIVLTKTFQINHPALYRSLMSLKQPNVTVTTMKDYLFSRDLIKAMIDYDGIKYIREGCGIIKKPMIMKALDFKNIEMLRDYIYHEQKKWLTVPLYLCYQEHCGEVYMIYALEFGDEAIVGRKIDLLKEGKK